MKARESSAVVLGLVVVAVAAAQLVHPDPAQATEALFRVERILYQPGFTFGSTQPSAKAPPATASVGTTAKAASFVLPRSFIDITRSWSCAWYGTYGCWPGYPVSGGVYSSLNLQGHFRPNNPYAATSVYTVKFPTTMGSTGPPYGTGYPVTPTTTFSGDFDFDRSGAIQIVPGPNRFGGTMRIFLRPGGSYWYQYITFSTPLIWKAYGGWPTPYQRTEYSESRLGEIDRSLTLPRYLLTTFGKNKFTTTTTTYGPYITYDVQYIATIAPWTTGRVKAYRLGGSYPTALTYTGYDNRTSAGLSGTVSLVRPRLIHSYLKSEFPWEPIRKIRSYPEVWKMTVRFLGGVDSDGDTVSNALDNCVNVPNGPAQAPNNQCDTDGDGYGNACDADLNNDGVVDGSDFSLLASLFTTTGASDADLDCDLVVGGPDYATFGPTWLLTPGPSGLDCAGTVPCP
jgi:hypothetical protein